MKRSMIGRLVTLVALVVLATAGMAAAQGATDPATAHDEAIRDAGKTPPTPEELEAATTTLAANLQVPGSCSLCYTCGGAWPTYSGTIPTASAAVERDSSCLGGFSTNRNDTIPFLCCR